ncbi:bifunctional DNA primase/polymerase [Bradyrhizobium liaoningense]|uniref:bifunctional DNA primase/polymerase n=1 Tax=Bradyrhizobium liaoningense TaxID=43992 RepID=UPI001BA9E77A|nr:bifunctional DNA primase/polymerase [Bradyrhizobium liaoningense]MBR1032294.1 bifunctional DNA primase/polymerase [Bradyrhizobium liaoningense]
MPDSSSFESAALAMHGNGYSLLPIGAGTKSPGIYRGFVTDEGDGPWFGLPGWQSFCTERASSAAKPAAWGRMADRYGGGIGLACGFGGLVAVDIDDDALVDPILAVLPPVMVAKRGRKGRTALFRAVEPLPSKNYRTADKRGLLDFLSVGKQTVLPPTIHPDTGHPYEWTTERTLLDTQLEELPAFTGAHLDAMEAILRAHGWDEPAPRQPRGVAVERPAQGATADDMLWHDDVNTVALSNLAAWAPALLPGGRWRGPTYRVVAPWRASGSGREMSKRNPNLSFHPSGIQDFGTMETFTPIGVVAKACEISYGEARDWLRDKLGLPGVPLIHLRNGASASAVVSSYPDQRVPLDEATARLQTLTGPELANAILNGIAVRNQAALKPPLILPVHPVTAVRSEAGIGKTHAAREGTSKQARLGRRIAYVVPRHDLAEQIAADFALDGVKAEVYRGYERPDPLAPDHLMCRNIPAYRAARDLGVSIRDSVCERRIENEVIRCPLAKACGMERQREARPSVWGTPAALLYTKRPDFIFPPDAVVIDESFIDGAIGDPVKVDVAALLGSKIEGCSDEDHDAVERFRHRLGAAIKANGDGPLARAALIDHGIDAEVANAVGWLEQRRVTSTILRPDMRESELKTAAYRHAARNKLARDAGTLWQEIAIFLEEWKIEPTIGDRSQSGRITVEGGKVSVTPLRTVHPSWRDAPTLVLDATAPPASLIAIALGEIQAPDLPPVVTEQPVVAAKWPDHVRVRQIIGAPVSMSKLGLWEAPKPRNVLDVVRFVRLRAALAAPSQIGVVTYKGMLDQITGQLPANVIARHFGALAGMNDMQDVAGLIVIGRPAPRRSAVEALASVFAGRPVSGGEGHFFDKDKAGIQLADGSVVATTIDRHPEPIAEALRWRITVGELLQAVGRLRPHRRSEPCWLDIVCDVPLPVTVHEVVRWDGVAPGPTADMAAEGVVLANSRDAGLAFGTTDWGARGVGGFSIESLIRDSTDSSPVRKFTYQKTGPGQKRYTGWYLPGILPGVVPAIRVWLEERLGPLASLQVERTPSRAAFAKIGRETADRLKFANVLSPALEAIAAFFDELQQNP